ncbi:hypothetical protein CLCR_09210 [Cladophialophora carrionii]|uniref:Uncharacterized protein n=1 Tax=Cladophialophora carrionii TaxID=86049 RepID=A0A1C1CRZ3_9EURO|nr:hypothetical protein CLCR_09210 [Cladophialophora carrionii]
MSPPTGPLCISLKFLKWLPLYEKEKPFQIFINIPEDATDKRTTNLAFENVKVTIEDVRSFPRNHFLLDKHGFTYHSHYLQLDHIADRESVEQRYLPAMESLLRSALESVDRVFFFDWRLRKNAPETEGALIDLNDLTTWLRPALHLHVGT